MFLLYFTLAMTLATISRIPAENVLTVQELITHKRSVHGAPVRRSASGPGGEEDLIIYVESLLIGNNKENTGKVDHGQCGRVDAQPTPLVTHGVRADRGMWPWHIALYHYMGASHSYKCGGTLVGKRTVVTAAHCVKDNIDATLNPETLAVYLGKHHLKFWTGVQEKQVTDILVHPEYNGTTFNADIAILILSSPVDYTSVVRPVCLWDKNQIVETGEPGTVIGWGLDEKGKITGELMTAKMPIVSYEECIKSYPSFFSQFLNGNNFCAGYRNGTSACNGDSGGGLVFRIIHTVDSEATWYLRGVVSISTRLEDSRCDPKHFVIFTDVSRYLDWIKENLR